MTMTTGQSTDAATPNDQGGDSVRNGPAPARVIRIRRPNVSVRYSRRTFLAGCLVLLAVAVTFLLSLGIGFEPGDLFRILSGGGTRPEETTLYILRMPRLITAIFVGAALGASGAIFQSITRNPLGSPDIIGFTMGASFGAVIMTLNFKTGQIGIVAGALVGGLAVSVLIYALANRGGTQGYRLILVGIGITALLGSVVSYVLLRADVRAAQEAYAWLVGSLSSKTGVHAVSTGIGVAILLPAAALLTRRMRALEMGEDTANALGIPVKSSTRWLLVVGTALAAVAVAAAGPIGFVALSAPQIMRRLTAAPIGILSSAVMGSFLLVLSDLLVQRIFGSTMGSLQPPVGIMTASLGGCYLIWLLYRENRANRG